MKLQELYIRDYKVLQDFVLKFDEQSSVSVLIGENGSGKTTVMECLTLIFVELFKKNTLTDLYQSNFPFKFSLTYILSTGPQVGFNYEHEIRSTEPYIYNGEVSVKIEYDIKLSLTVIVDKSETYNTHEQLSLLLSKSEPGLYRVRNLFPENLVIYYSGITSTLDRIAADYDSDVILGMLDGKTKINQDLFYFRPENFPILLIGLLSYRYGDIPERLASGFKVRANNPFAQITIALRRPKWAKPKSRSETFWGALGELSSFLSVIRGIANTIFEKDRITFTIKAVDQLDAIWSVYGEEKSLFKYLVTLQANDLIDSIEIDIHKDGELIVPYQRLSEGEKQLLIIMALRELLTVDENTLFLLDEPDTYLHPEWKRNFIAEFLPTESISNYLAYYLITTHSPGIVSGMQKEQLHILRKIEGRSVPKIFSFNPYGKPEDQILFEFFGLDGLRFKPVQEKLEYLKSLISLDDYNSDQFN
jgi:AAA15 family ATPase/GTPase